jgi:hypothetical protein
LNREAVKEEVRQELEEFKKIITAEPPERAIIDLKEGKITVFDWWRNEAEDFPRLGKLAERIFLLTPSTASVERSFKSRGLIHNKTRNRMASDTTSKLTFLKINAPLLHQPHQKRRPLPPGNQVQEEDPGGGMRKVRTGKGIQSLPKNSDQPFFSVYLNYWITDAPARESFLWASCRWFAKHVPKVAALR